MYAIRSYYVFSLFTQGLGAFLGIVVDLLHVLLERFVGVMENVARELVRLAERFEMVMRARCRDVHLARAEYAESYNFV